MMESNPNPKNNQTTKKHWFNSSNVSTFVLVVFLLAMVISPNVKAFVIQSLMKVGLFQADVSESDVTGKDGKAINAPEAIFLDGNQNSVRLSELRGKLVVLNFWATWCPSCIAEMPSLNKLYQRYKTNNYIVFLMVDADGNYAKAKTFMERLGFDLPVYTQAGEVPASLFENSLPTTVIISASGKIVFRHEGGADYENPKVYSFIDGLLQSK